MQNAEKWMKFDSISWMPNTKMLKYLVVQRKWNIETHKIIIIFYEMLHRVCVASFLSQAIVLWMDIYSFFFWIGLNIKTNKRSKNYDIWLSVARDNNN